MARTLDPASVRAYLARDWAQVRARKRAYWRARLERGGLVEALAITEQLRVGSTEQHREEDLETHRRVAKALACTAPKQAARQATRQATTTAVTAARGKGRPRRVR
ncbi:MAG: hypothetical protein IPQ07_35355 [Myxococcales bacterium]|nr:hypothetical protein [Myxococcales bacterium]